MKFRAPSSCAELALAFDATDAPALLYRKPLLARRSFQRAILSLLLVGTGSGTVLAMRPPELVRRAIEHEHAERALRGTLMESAALLQHLGLGASKVVPGFPQLMRPCDIDGHLVYHLTTFFEKRGMVTVFAFDKAVALQEGYGWWGNVYWKVITSRNGKPLVLVAQKKPALDMAQSQFGKSIEIPTPDPKLRPWTCSGTSSSWRSRPCRPARSSRCARWVCGPGAGSQCF
jgi:hypothetical protein